MFKFLATTLALLMLVAPVGAATGSAGPTTSPPETVAPVCATETMEDVKGQLAGEGLEFITTVPVGADGVEALVIYDPVVDIYYVGVFVNGCWASDLPILKYTQQELQDTFGIVIN